jgi:hypothetical protein
MGQFDVERFVEHVAHETRAVETGWRVTAGTVTDAKVLLDVGEKILDFGNRLFDRRKHIRRGIGTGYFGCVIGSQKGRGVKQQRSGNNGESHETFQYPKVWPE